MPVRGGGREGVMHEGGAQGGVPSGASAGLGRRRRGWLAGQVHPVCCAAASCQAEKNLKDLLACPPHALTLSESQRAPPRCLAHLCRRCHGHRQQGPSRRCLCAAAVGLPGAAQPPHPPPARPQPRPQRGQRAARCSGQRRAGRRQRRLPRCRGVLLLLMPRLPPVCRVYLLAPLLLSCRPVCCAR